MLLWSAFILLLLGNAIGWLTLGPLPDEAYYWTWSRQLQWGYFDHPPMVAWIIRAATTIGQEEIIWIRLPAVLLLLASGFLCGWLAFSINHKWRSALLSALIFFSFPATQIGFHAITPDQPLVFFSLLAYCFARRLEWSNSIFNWLGLAAAIAAAILSKYTALFVALAIALALLLDPKQRHRLSHWKPWSASLLALLLITPMLLWNANHDWISFRFQWQHGTAAASRGLLAHGAEFLAGQALVLMPWTALALLAVAWRHRQPRSWSSTLLRTGLWLPWLCFAALAIRNPGEANWALPAYLPACPLLACALIEHRYWRVIGSSVLLSSALLVNLARFPFWMQWIDANELPNSRSQLSLGYGWPELAQRLDNYRHEQGLQHCQWLTYRHQTAASLALQWRTTKDISAAKKRRPSQFQLWLQQPEACLYIRRYDGPQPNIPMQQRINNQVFALDKAIRIDSGDRFQYHYALYHPLPIEAIKP